MCTLFHFNFALCHLARKKKKTRENWWGKLCPPKYCTWEHIIIMEWTYHSPKYMANGTNICWILMKNFFIFLKIDCALTSFDFYQWENFPLFTFSYCIFECRRNHSFGCIAFAKINLVLLLHPPGINVAMNRWIVFNVLEQIDYQTLW